MNVLKKKYLCLLGVVLSLMACQTTPINVRPVPNALLADADPANGDFYEHGKSYLKASNIGLAIDAFRQDILSRGNNVRSLNGLGIAYDMLGRYDLSQSFYERSLDLEPASTVTLSNLAYSHYRQGEYDVAMTLANKVQKILAAGSEKNKAAATAVLDNLKSAGTRKMNEETGQAEKPAVGYRVQRIGERNWAVIEEDQKKNFKKTVPYKSKLAVEKTFERAPQTKKRKFKITAQSETFACCLVDRAGYIQMTQHMAKILNSKGAHGVF